MSIMNLIIAETGKTETPKNIKANLGQREFIYFKHPVIHSERIYRRSTRDMHFVDPLSLISGLS